MCHIAVVVSLLMPNVLLKSHSCYTARLVIILVLLEKFFGVKVPHENLSVIWGWEKSADILCIVNWTNVILMVKERWEGLLSVYLLCLSFRFKSLVALLIFLITIVAPNANSRIVWAWYESIYLFNKLDLVYPISMIVKVSEQSTASHFIACGVSRQHACIVYTPQFYQPITTRCE